MKMDRALYIKENNMKYLMERKYVWTLIGITPYIGRKQKVNR